MEDLGIKIKKIRESKNITKSELARLIDVSPAYITMLENGKKQNPSRMILEKIANALGVSLYELLPVSGGFQEALSATLEFYKDNTSIVKNESNKLISHLVKGEDFSLHDIEKVFSSVILNILSESNKSTTLGYTLNDFSAEEVNEISNFVFNSYILKIDEILIRHKKDELLLNKGLKIAHSKLSKKDLSYIENLSFEEQSEILKKANEIANKILSIKNKEK